MIPLILGCLVGGCLDVPIDSRPLHQQIYQDQLSPGRVVSCWGGEDGKTYYPDCRDWDPWGFDENEDDDSFTHSFERDY